MSASPFISARRSSTTRRIETVPADLLSLDDCRTAARGVDYVFHAAGAVAAAGISTSGLMDAISTNLILTLRILQAAWDEGVQRIQIFSSSTAYPPADHPIKEEEMWTGPTYPGYFGYGWSRRYMERVSEFVASKSGLQVALVRPSAVYGPWDNFAPTGSHVIPALIRRAVDREDPYVVWGTGDEVRDFLHVDDLAAGCLQMLQKHATCDPVNIGYGHAVTIRDVVDVILKAAGHDRCRSCSTPPSPARSPSAWWTPRRPLGCSASAHRSPWKKVCARPVRRYKECWLPQARPQ